MPAKKKLTPQQQRERKAKILLGILSVVLVAVLGFELPSMMGGKKSAASGSTLTTTLSATTTTSGAAGGLASLQISATPQSAQLSKFSRFAVKNPFVAPAGAASGAGLGGGSSTPAASTTSPVTPKLPATPPSVTFTSGGTTTPAAPTGPMVLGVVMRFNGARKVIAVGSEFPVKNPVFKLLAVGRKAMWISLVGGSFGAGKQTLMIQPGHPIKLVNTTISISYVIRLLKVTTVPKPAPIATTPSTTTSAGTTTSSTTSTPTTPTTTSGP